MSDAQIVAIQRFINNPVMAEAVFASLMATFTKPRPNADVYEKAARFISIENLQEGWKELAKYKVDNTTEEKSTATPHV